MNTPICDFVSNYITENKIRLHMPGHKGKSFLGIEPYDITEVNGADALFEADGIILESERNASELFGTSATLYSTEGSSLCIRAMLCLAVGYARSQGKTPIIIAGRNAHKTFISASALLDFSLSFIPENDECSYLSCNIDLVHLESEIIRLSPTAIYVTSPDYLGNTVDIRSLSTMCKKHGVLLLVDNAHGAYLKFIEPSCHPMDLGADICCDSAHKTLPVLTGGAYLHISKDAPAYMRENAKSSMALFASTSPSYLILQSLDIANRYLTQEGYQDKLKRFIHRVSELKAELINHGFTLLSYEPLKISISTKSYGYTGYEFADKLRESGIECEFSDPDYTVMMLTPENSLEDIAIILDKLKSIPRKAPILTQPPKRDIPQRAMSVKDAIFSKKELIPCSASKGRTLAALNVGCPPAVPIVICGEIINDTALELFDYYGFELCEVVL